VTPGEAVTGESSGGTLFRVCQEFRRGARGLARLAGGSRPLMNEPIPIGYVLPVRWERTDDRRALTEYLRWLGERAEVVVVDGSPPAVFERNAAQWDGVVTHLRPDSDLRYRNGKVNGVCTGMRYVGTDRVIIADDDVRYDEGSLRRVADLLAEADLVVPQNYFRPLPWHARWDTARGLLNRAFGADYPGTLAVRRATFEAARCYDGDVLFENLELIRTVRAFGGEVRHAGNVLVRRLPPDAVIFRNQRIRQAYDSLAQPTRLCTELLLLPSAAAAVALRRPGFLAAVALSGVALAERGRRRDGGTAVYPASSALWAPLWLAERALCSWLAMGARVFRGGARYRDHRIRAAAHAESWLRRRSGPEPTRLPLTDNGPRL
jgi:hypothetical protein